MPVNQERPEPTCYALGMPCRATRLLAAAVSAVAIAATPPLVGALGADTLPASLTNAEFWSLSEALSEPATAFRANWKLGDNVLSNEATVSKAAALLKARAKSGGVYLGVGPEQNFTYIAAARPRLAIITDIRRGNLHLHLLYKAIFETTSNRSEFVARLFARRPARDLPTRPTARQLMDAYAAAAPVSEPEFQSNVLLLQNHLTESLRLPLTQNDLDGIAVMHRAFYRFGPGINYTSLTSDRSGDDDLLSYASLMALTDDAGVERSYLATDEAFSFVKALHTKNLIVPVVGDFAGSTALRAIGRFIRQRDAVVSVFYLSNVVMWLSPGGIRQAFCANAAALPVDDASLFVLGQRSDWLVPMTAGAPSCTAG
jgi:hypothetical protein